MARARRVIWVSLALAGSAVLAAILALSSGTVQTALVRALLARRPEWQASVGHVQLGWGRALVEDLQWRQGPIAVAVPVAEADLALWPLLTGGRWQFATVRMPGAEVRVVESVRPLLPTVGGVLEGIAHGFGGWELPVDLAIGQLDLEGAVRVPGWPAATRLKITGGGLGEGREARLALECQAETGNPEVAQVGAAGTLTFHMRSARRPDQLSFEGEVRAAGTRWAQPVRVSLAWAATDHGEYQDYRMTCWTDERPLIAWGARMTDAVAGAPARMNGTWMLDVRPGDLTPLLPGSPLAAVSFRSEGRFAADEPFSGFELEGDWHGATDAPRRVWSGWPDDRAARFEGRFRLHQAGEVSRINHVQATVSAGDAQASWVAERPFDLRWQSGRAWVAPQPVPLAKLELTRWPWNLLPAELTPSPAIAFGALSGKLDVSARDGGWSFRSDGMLATEPGAGTAAVRLWTEGIAARGEVALDWLAAGWQLEVKQLVLHGAAGDFGRGEIKSGRLAEAGQPLKLAGKVNFDLGRVDLGQCWPEVAWRRGGLSVDFAASLGAVRGWRAQIELNGASAQVGRDAVSVPAMKIDARVETDATGRLAFDWPILIGEGEARGDLRLAGTLKGDGPNLKWEASVSGQSLRRDDLAALLALGGAEDRWAARALAGEGRIGLRVGRLGWTDGREFRGLEAEWTVKQLVGELKAKADWSAGGQVVVKAELHGDPSAAVGARVEGEVVVEQMPAAELWRGVGPAEGVPLEGLCDATLRFAGGVASPLDKLGELSVVSRGGVFHGLPVSFVGVAESTNRLTAWIASAELAFNTLTGRSTEAEIAGRSQAVAELVRGLHAVSFDQFTLRAVRAGHEGWQVREVALIAPETRLLGDGTVGSEGGAAAPLALALQWRTRGRPAELLRYLGVLEEKRDTLGYTGCAIPVRVTGTLGRRDATELNQRLAALSVEKPGMMDKALEFLGRWRNPNAGGVAKP